jgi:sugar phosphate isomerase/epimerase
MKIPFNRIIVAAGFAAALAGCLRAPDGIVPASRIGVCSWSYQKPIAEVAVEMEKTGVKGIHLALGPFLAPDKRHGAAEGAAALARVKAKIASGEWKLLSTMIGFPQEDYTTLESIRKTGGVVPDDVWPRNKALFAAAAKMTKELGAPFLSTHAGFLDEHDKAAYAKFVERLTWMRDECAKWGVKLILESGQETAPDLANFMKKVPGIGINFDPANMILYGKGDPIAALDHLMPWIDQIHIKDAKATTKPGTWGTEVAWSEGQVGGRAFIAALQAKGYKGHFVIERESGTQRAKDIASAVEKLKK